MRNHWKNFVYTTTSIICLSKNNVFKIIIHKKTVHYTMFIEIKAATVQQQRANGNSKQEYSLSKNFNTQTHAHTHMCA